jgi:hypothetical protein
MQEWKRLVGIAACMVALVAFAANAQDRLKKPVSFAVQVNPLGFLISPDVDDFEVTNGMISEDVEGFGSYTPNLKLGMSLDAGEADIDILGGVGWLGNLIFDGTYYTGEVAFRVKPGDGKFTIGPRVGWIGLDDADWSDDADIDFEGNDGWFAGVALTLGGETASFSASIDYVDVVYDVEASGGWVPNDTEIDMSGYWINLGLMLRF